MITNKLFFVLIIFSLSIVNSAVFAMYKSCHLLKDQAGKELFLVTLRETLRGGSLKETQLTEKMLAIIQKLNSRTTLTLCRKPEEKAGFAKKNPTLAKIITSNALLSCEPSSRWLDFYACDLVVRFAFETVQNLLTSVNPSHGHADPSSSCSDCRHQPRSREQLVTDLANIKNFSLNTGHATLTVGQFREILAEVFDGTLALYERISALSPAVVTMASPIDLRFLEMCRKIDAAKQFFNNFFQSCEANLTLPQAVHKVIGTDYTSNSPIQNTHQKLGLFLEHFAFVRVQLVNTLQLTSIAQEKGSPKVHITACNTALSSGLVELLNYTNVSWLNFCTTENCNTVACVKNYDDFLNRFNNLVDHLSPESTATVPLVSQPVPSNIENAAPMVMVKRCNSCNNEEDAKNPLLKCGACKKAVYCNRDCQRNHWTAHKPFCKSS